MFLGMNVRHLYSFCETRFIINILKYRYLELDKRVRKSENLELDKKVSL